MRLKQVALTFALVTMSTAVFSAHHEKTTTPTENNYVLLSTFGTAQGERTDDLEKELIAMVKQRESDGFDNCGLYRHSFVGPRLFYAYCYFTDYAQLDAIQAKARARSTTPMNSIQKYSSHADNIVQVQKRNMTEAPENSVFMTWRFGPYLTINERQERAELLFSGFNKAFGGCNLYLHAWGAEIAHYVSCGFENFTDFGKKDAAINKILGEQWADLKLDIKDHSDEFLTKVLD